MFGYVRPSDGHLTAEDKQRFQAAYCGLCRSLGRRYGLAARMILNYDLAFLAMLLSREPECPRRTAGARPTPSGAATPWSLSPPSTRRRT